jgi:hypothetical protein
MNRSHVARMAIITAIGIFSGAAFAQDDSDRRVQYKAKTEIDFEGLDVAGELVKPAGALLLDRKKASFNPLIRLRTDFNEEMKESVDQIK